MNKTTRDLLIILFILMIFTAISRRNKTKSTVNCGDQICGGFASGGMVGMSPPCPEGCKCGSVDPRIPDAPAKCEPI